jgi:uncharacterized protein (DUF362 family)
MTEPRAPLSRRAFLARGAGAAAAFAGAAAIGLELRARGDRHLWDPSAFQPPTGANVAVVPRTSYDGDISGTVRDGLTAIGASFAGARVVLKPNFVEFDPHAVVNTDPRLVAGAVEAIRRMGAASVAVAEGPGHRRDTRYVVAAAGLLDALREVDAPFTDLNVAPSSAVPLRSFYTSLDDLWIPNVLRDADVIVSMPKMKTHHWAAVTLSLKNCFGCLPGRVYGWPKNALHWVGIDNAILDVAGAVRPSYAIVDGIVGMQGNGPINGDPIASGVLVFGDDLVATDTITTTMMGMDPDKIPYLHEAARFLGEGDPERIEQRGEDPGGFTTAFAPAPGAASAATGTSGY